jgi:hypothetical protein
MYCPKCGTQNADDASFCRGCGANVSLVPQALAGNIAGNAAGNIAGHAAGQVPKPVAEAIRGRAERERRDRQRWENSPSLSKALVRTFVGIAFVLVALSVKNVHQIAGHIWWFWMLIPAAGALGKGVAEFVRLSQYQGPPTPQLPPGNAYTPPFVSMGARPPGELPPQRAGADFYTPRSVTENTTKLLEKDQ